MGRLEELRINAYLSEIARGYGNNSFIADKLFPTIPSEKEKIDIFEFNKEAFQIYDTERAIRANSAHCFSCFKYNPCVTTFVA